MKKEYEFTVCAHPVNFHILQGPGSHNHCAWDRADESGRPILSSIGALVTWNWQSDSGILSDMEYSINIREASAQNNVFAPAWEPGDHGDRNDNWDGRLIQVGIIDDRLDWLGVDEADRIISLQHYYECTICGREGPLGYETHDEHYSRTLSHRYYVIHEYGYCVHPPGCATQWNINDSTSCTFYKQ